MPKTFTPTITHNREARQIDIETELGFIRIEYGLTDYEYPGQRVEYVQMIPNHDEDDRPLAKVQDQHFMELRRWRP